MCDELLQCRLLLGVQRSLRLHLSPFISSGALFVIRELFVMWAWLSRMQGTLPRGPEPQWESQANGAAYGRGQASWGAGAGGGGGLAGEEVSGHPGQMARQAWALGGLVLEEPGEEEAVGAGGEAQGESQGGLTAVTCLRREESEQLRTSICPLLSFPLTPRGPSVPGAHQAPPFLTPLLLHLFHLLPRWAHRLLRSPQHCPGGIFDLGEQV